jgi:hypothetical protein
MATRIRIAGAIITRTWDGRRFKFEITDGERTIVLVPTTFEAKELSILFNGDDITGKQEIDK